MNIDFYASWNGPQVAALFRAVVGMTESSGYTVFLLTMTTLGLLGVTIAAVLRWKPFEMLSWFMSVVLFYSIAFVPKITVTVEDTRAMTAEAVTGVPIGLGLTAALSSKIGHFAANLFETALGDVDASKFTKFGAVFPERAAAALAKAGPVTAETRAVLDPFLNRCVMPEILESPAKLTELMTAENLAATVTARGWTNPARVLMIEGSPVYCDEAAQKLLTLLKTREVPAQEKLLMAKLSGGNTGSAVLEAALKKAIPEAEAKMLGISRTLSESLTHAVLLTEIPGAAECQAGSLSMPLAGAVALAKAQGSLASEISFRTMGELAAAFLPKLRNLLEFILIAAFPIVLGMLVAFGAEGTRVARMYLTLFLWLALWAPIASVINYLLIHLDANPMNRIAEIYGGLTLEAADFIRDQGATSQAMAGYLMLLVPLISYLLARASDMGAANLASSMMQPAAGAAQSQSAQLSAGNVAAGNASIGNSSVNNANANKSDISTGFVAGSVTRTATAQGSVVRDSDRGQVTSVTAASSDLGVTGASTLTQGRSTQQSASDQGSVSSSRTTSYAEGVRTENSDSAGWTVRRSEESSSSRTQNESQTLSQGETASRSIGEHAQSSLSSSSTMTEASGFTTRTGVKLGANASESADFQPGGAADDVLQRGNASNAANTANAANSLPYAGFRATGPSGIPGFSPLPKDGAQQGSRELSARASVLGNVSIGGDITTRTGAANDDQTANTRSVESGTSWRTDESQQSARTTGEEMRSGSSQTGAVTEGETVTRGRSAAHTASDAAETREGRSWTKSAGETSASTLGTGARLDSYLMHQAIAEYGSPEAALEALADPSERAAFARSTMDSAERQRFVPLSGEDPSRARVDEASADAHAKLDSLRERTGSQFGGNAADVLREGDARSLQIGNGGAEKPVASDLTQETREVLLVHQGALIRAQELWKSDHHGLTSALGLLLPGGRGYASPEAIYQGLLEASETNPEVRDALMKAGVERETHSHR